MAVLRGGMTITGEITLPGFKSDVHAFGYQLANFSPVPAELEIVTMDLSSSTLEYLFRMFSQTADMRQCFHP
jgi:hypothetical protein